jgi:pimeloyl-ACP methyl ester carboxylesterase
MNKTTSADGTIIAFDRTGDGPAVIHVGGALNLRLAGAPLAEALAPDFTVYTYDRRGRGDSGDTAPFAVEREIEDIEALIAEAGGSAALYGMSSGGALALEAVARGLAITKLAVYEAPYTPEDETRLRESRVYDAELTELLSANRRGDAVELFMRLVGVPTEMISHLRAAPMWPAMEAVAPTLAYDSAALGFAVTGGRMPAERFAAVKIPALVMDGGASPAWMRETARRLADALPHARHRSLAGQTHDVATEALAPVLKEFLAA